MKYLVVADFDLHNYGLSNCLHKAILKAEATNPYRMAVTVKADTELGTQILLLGIPCQILDTEAPSPKNSGIYR
jgi:hypothetical protein